MGGKRRFSRLFRQFDPNGDGFLIKSGFCLHLQPELYKPAETRVENGPSVGGTLNVALTTEERFGIAAHIMDGPRSLG
jgi:hypothetical protein